jgi:hypothetical protein
MLSLVRVVLDGATHLVDNPRGKLEVILVAAILLVELVNTLHHW